MPKKMMKLRDKLKMESEHTQSTAKQKKIVKQHEDKFGDKYYPTLKKVENKLKKKK